MIFTKYYDPQGKYIIHFAHDDYNGIIKFLGIWAELPNIEFEVVEDPVFGESFEFKTSILEDNERIPYEKIMLVFHALMFPSDKFTSEFTKMFKRWENFLSENGWTLKEWEDELFNHLE